MSVSVLASSNVPVINVQQNSPASLIATPFAEISFTGSSISDSINNNEEANKRLKIFVDSSKYESESKFAVTSKLHTFSHDEPPIIRTIANPVLFRDSTQIKPIYWLVVEFNPPDPAIKNIPDFRFSESGIPWFLNAYHKSKMRLSSWKDGNSLYASRRTFH